MAFFENLSKFYKKQNRTSNVFHGTSLDFPEIDINQAIEALEVKEEATKDGESNIPNSERENLGGTESRYTASFEGDKTFHINNSLERVAILEKEAWDTKLESKLATFNNFTKTITEKFDDIITKGKAELLLVKKRRSEIKKEYEKFRTDNRIERSSITPRSGALATSIIISVLILESLLNGYFFGKGNPLGVVGGWFLALILSSINIFIGITVGKYILPFKNHISFSKRNLAILGYLIYLVAIIGFNFIVGHWRDISALGINPSIELLLERYANPFLFKDIESLLLIMVGFLFSLYASIHGYRLDDPYPGYGAISRRWEEIVEEYNETTSEIQNDLEGYRDERIQANIADADDIKVRFNVIKEIVNELSNYIERFDQYMVLLIKYCNAVLQTYRQENERGRSTPTPKYFANEFNFDQKPQLKNNISELHNLLTSSKPTIDTLKKIQEGNEKMILSEYKKSRKQFDEIEEFE